MLKRLIVFSALGPVIPLIVHGTVLSIIARARPPFDLIFPVSYIAYLYGTLPAVAAGLVDAYFVKWLTPLWRAIATGLFASTAVGAVLMFMSAPGLYGLVGFVPAAVCSAFCAWLDRRREMVRCS